MGCGFSKFETTEGDVASSCRIKALKPPLERIVERKKKNEYHHPNNNRDDNCSLSEKFLQSEGLDIIPRGGNHGDTSPSAAGERKIEKEIHANGYDVNYNDKGRGLKRGEEGKEKVVIREVVVVDRHVVRDSDDANGRCDDDYGSGEEEDEDYYSEREDSIAFQFQGSPSFKEYCIPPDDNGNCEDGRKGKKPEMSSKSNKVAQSNNGC